MMQKKDKQLTLSRSAIRSLYSVLSLSALALSSSRPFCNFWISPIMMVSCFDTSPLGTTAGFFCLFSALPKINKTYELDDDDDANGTNGKLRPSHYLPAHLQEIGEEQYSRPEDGSSLEVGSDLLGWLRWPSLQCQRNEMIESQL